MKVLQAEITVRRGGCIYHRIWHLCGEDEVIRWEKESGQSFIELRGPAAARIEEIFEASPIHLKVD